MLFKSINIIWCIIIGGSLITYSLRAAPFFLLRNKAGVGPRLTRFFAFSGIAVIGQMIGDSLFSPLMAGAKDGVLETLLLAGFTGLSFVCMARTGRQLSTFLLTFTLFCGFRLVIGL